MRFNLIGYGRLFFYENDVFQERGTAFNHWTRYNLMQEEIEMKNIRLNEFIELIKDGEAIVAGYEISRSQVEKEIWHEMKECFQGNDILENHLKDFIAMVELQNFFDGLYQGIRIANNIKLVR